MASEEKKKKRAQLLYQAGSRVREIFWQIPDRGDDNDMAVTKLNAYIEPKKHRLYEVYKFCEASPGNNETLDQYRTRLRRLSLLYLRIQTLEFSSKLYYADISPV